jgi:hypothetical protein
VIFGQAIRRQSCAGMDVVDHPGDGLEILKQRQLYPLICDKPIRLNHERIRRIFRRSQE